MGLWAWVVSARCGVHRARFSPRCAPHLQLLYLVSAFPSSSLCTSKADELAACVGLMMGQVGPNWAGSWQSHSSPPDLYRNLNLSTLWVCASNSGDCSVSLFYSGSCSWDMWYCKKRETNCSVYQLFKSITAFHAKISHFGIWGEAGQQVWAVRACGFYRWFLFLR